ncbi:MAG: hypothetical protein H7332_12940 [Bdellovibrionales bacterium]|nr:hypothetical protein [Ramlibacter sp.]
MVMPQETLTVADSATNIHAIPPVIIRNFLARFLTPQELGDFAVANRLLLGTGQIVRLLTTLRIIQEPYRRFAASGQQAKIQAGEATLWQRYVQKEKLEKSLQLKTEEFSERFTHSWFGDGANATAQVLHAGWGTDSAYQPLYECIPSLKVCKLQFDRLCVLQDASQLTYEDVKNLMALALSFGELRTARDMTNILNGGKNPEGFAVFIGRTFAMQNCINRLQDRILERAGESLMGHLGIVREVLQRDWPAPQAQAPTVETQTLETGLPARGAPLTQPDRLTGELLTAPPFKVTKDQQQYRFTHLDGTVVVVNARIEPERPSAAAQQ